MNDKEQKYTPVKRPEEFRPPFRYDEWDTLIKCQSTRGRETIAFRTSGYTYLTSEPSISEEKAFEIQDRLGKWAANALSTHDELVAALEAVTKDMNEHGVLWTSTKRIVNAALAKARGEEVGE